MIFISSDSPDNQSAYPCFYLAPQLPASNTVTNWSDPGYIAEQIAGLVGQFVQDFNIDPDRIYVTGVSMGGGGTFAQATRHPNRYAAAVPLAGWGDGKEADYLHLPLWAGHSNDDPRVPVSSTDTPIANLRALGGDPIYTRTATGGHGGPSSLFFSAGHPLVPWMMAQRRGEPNDSSLLSLNITQPETDGTYIATTDSVDLAGTAQGNTFTEMEWKNLRSNDTGDMTAAADWSVTAVPLRSGLNRVRVLGTTGSFTSQPNGNTTLSDTITIVERAEGDTVAPEIAVAHPSYVGDRFLTSHSTLELSGTASDDMAVDRITWSSDRLGHGIASGTTDWWLSDIDLFPGENHITLTVWDIADNSTTETLAVVYDPALVPPEVVAWGPTDDASDADVTVTFRWLKSQTAYSWSVQSCPDPAAGQWQALEPAASSTEDDPDDAAYARVTVELNLGAAADTRALMRVVAQPAD